MQIHKFLLNLKRASAGGFSRTKLLLSFVVAGLIAPAALLTLGGSQSSNLPWYFWAAILLLLVAVVGIGFLKFTLESRGVKGMSISPDRPGQPPLDPAIQAELSPPPLN